MKIATSVLVRCKVVMERNAAQPSIKNILTRIHLPPKSFTEVLLFVPQINIQGYILFKAHNTEI